MAGDEKWLIEAIQKKLIVQKVERGQAYLYEPHVYARVMGNREVMIGYQIRGAAKYHSAPDEWHVLSLSAVSPYDSKTRFETVREVPQDLLAMAQEIYCQAKFP